jgi:glycosyltransferase involved in cell wall biosynthesis
MAPMRVALVADVLVLPMGGVSRSVLCLMQELDELDPAGIEVTLVARSRPEGTDGYAFRKSFSPRLKIIPGSVLALQRPFTLRDFDVVHYIDWRPPFDLRLARNASVVTQHGIAPLLIEEDYGRKGYEVMTHTLLRVIRHADLVVTPSESERQELLARSPVDPDRVVPIHHGVDHDRFYPPPELAPVRDELRARFGIDGRYVLSVANYQKKKNTERLVRAFAQRARDDGDLTLVFAGAQSADFVSVTNLIAELGLEPRVRLTGHLGDRELRALYACAAVFALPSLHESFGMPLLEAMACGAPVLASDVYCLPEVCGDAAEYVDPRDVGAIEQGLSRILDDESRAEELRRLGLQRAAGFTWRRAAEQHVEAYERALARTSA